MNKFIVISGCSSGGKSTLLSELKQRGYTVVEEAGRRIVEEHGDMDPLVRCEMITVQSVEAYHRAEKIGQAKDNLIFFDRSFLEGVCYFQSINVHSFDHLVNELRFYPTIFLAPPWQEIYVRDALRKHGFEDGVEEYDRLEKFYPQAGYQLLKLPKISVTARADWVLSKILRLE